MLINRCFKIRIYPTKNQIDSITRIFGCRRFVYNQYVEQCENFYKEYKQQKEQLSDISDLSDLELTKIRKKFSYKSEVELKREYSFLADKCIPASALQQARKDAEKAYQRYFESLKEMKEKKLKPMANIF